MTSVVTPHYARPGVQVVHPAHLDGDPTLATEILPGPPPLSSVQQQILKRDPKKNSASYSYLPTSDPGTTYAGLMFATPPVVQGSAPTVPEGPRPKRARVDKSRPQRARQLTASSLAPVELIDVDAGPSSPPPFIVAEGDLGTQPGPMHSLSRSHSASNGQEEASPSNNGRTRIGKDKGKGKAKETASALKVKTEPHTVSLLSPEPAQAGPFLTNEDHCSACRSIGSLVYCDSCPRAFHLLCLDPPMDPSDLPDADARWFCPSCCIRTNPPKKPPPSFMSPLIHAVQTTIPSEFQLPDDIRSFFKDVATGPQGGYIDNSGVKQPRLNRYGQLDGRDVYKLKDRNGAPVLCFRCGLSAIPASVAVPSSPSASTSHVRTPPCKAATSEDGWNGIISCDYCSLHWHLDCLDPPLTTIPPSGKKWMCPNHGAQVLNPKRRMPKSNAPVIEVTKPGQFNNGNIEIIPADPSVLHRRKVSVDEVLINGRKYRVPERVVILDFWNKVNGVPPQDDETETPISSPLTSISSLEDADEPIDISKMLSQSRSANSDQMQAAALLFGLAGVDLSAPAKVLEPPHSSSKSAPAPIGTNGRAHRRSRVKNAESSTSSAPLPVAKAPNNRSLRTRGNDKAKNGLNDSAQDEALKLTRIKLEVLDDESMFLTSPPESIAAPTPRPPKRSKVAAKTAEPKRRGGRKRKGQDVEPPPPPVAEQISALPNNSEAQTGNGVVVPSDPPRSPLKISIRLPTSMRAPAPKGGEQP